MSNLARAPRIGEVYLCRYPERGHTETPEFSGNHFVVIMSRKARIRGHATVVPLTTSPQDDDQKSLEIASPVGGRQCWVICNHLTTVSCRRLKPAGNPTPKIPIDTFQEIVKRCFRHLPDPNWTSRNC